MKKDLIQLKDIEDKMYDFRGQKVMFDVDAATYYEESITTLRRNVTRNIKRFPENSMYKLSETEIKKIALQSNTNVNYAFTMIGIFILSTILKSKRAVDVNIEIIRTICKLAKLTDIDNKYSITIKEINFVDEKTQNVFDVLNEMTIEQHEKPGNRFDFRNEE